MSRKLRSVLPVLLLTLTACGGGQEEASMNETSAEAPPAAPAPDAGSAPISPISSRGETAPAPAPGGEEAQIDFDLPAGWQSEPASGMRMAQASIPGAGGPGQLTVFYFGPGGGGDVESNIQRWVGQMEIDQGTEPARQTFESDNGFRITWVDVAGTLLPSTMGTGPTTPQPNSRLLGAVIEGPGGPWFFKATGPKATMDAEREKFLGMLRSARKRESA